MCMYIRDGVDSHFFKWQQILPLADNVGRYRQAVAPDRMCPSVEALARNSGVSSVRFDELHALSPNTNGQPAVFL